MKWRIPNTTSDFYDMVLAVTDLKDITYYKPDISGADEVAH